MQSEQRNWLLRSIEPEVLSDFSKKMTEVVLRKGDNLQSPGESVEWVYFPEGALVAAIAETLAGDSVVAALVGYDGALGAFEACGSRTSHMRGAVLVPGPARRMRASAYRSLYDASSNLRTAVHKHVEILLAEARHSVACNAIHPVEGRLARALLEALGKCDGGDLLAMTQESLAQMLGVQRTTIAVCVSALQKQGVVRSGRGVIEITDRDALEKAACSCHATLDLLRADIYSTRAESCDV